MKQTCIYHFCWVIHLHLLITCISGKYKTRNPHLEEYSTSGGRIARGVSATPHEFPFLVALKKEGIRVCGGSILNENIVVTAAHCFYNFNRDSYTVTTAEHNIQCHEGPEETYTVGDVDIHEEYNPILGLNDVAVIRISRPIKFNKYVGKITLPLKNYQFPETATIAGWGMLKENTTHVPAKLRKVEQTKYSSSGCIATRPGNVCYLGRDRSSSCWGDSGGPGVCTGAFNFVTLCAMVSKGLHCGETGFPNLHVNIPYYSDWIRARLDISKPGIAKKYALCGGLLNGTLLVIDGTFAAGQECDWVVHAPFETKAIFVATTTLLQFADKLWFTSLNNTVICKDCAPIKYDRNRPNQRYLIDGSGPFFIVSLRVDQSNTFTKRRLTLQILSVGPPTGVDKDTNQYRYFGGSQDTFAYPGGFNDYYLNSREVWLLINPNFVDGQILEIKWQYLNIHTAGDPTICPGDHLSIYTLQDNGKYDEVQRYCEDEDRFRPPDYNERRKGITILHFQSTDDSPFGRGFKGTYTINGP